MADESPLRDHRDIGQALDLFSFHDVAPGAVFWHGNGMIIWRELEAYMRRKLDARGYEEVSTPIMVKKDLFERSGHWDHYRKNMFTVEVENETYALKPMNCPEGALIYSSRIRSYRDLPLRFSEITDRIHRNELSGTLGGLVRVRQMSQDDAHIYVRPDQIEEETQALMGLIEEFYANFDMPLSFNLATKPENAMGDPALWQQAEDALDAILRKSNVSYAVKEKDGAFYGPKIDINVTDSQKREWTIATIQLDFQLPERLDLSYVDEGGEKKRPVIIHRAIFGSFERFIGILLEHCQGNLPVWLSPVQAAVLTVSDKSADYANAVAQKLCAAGIRIKLNVDSDTLNKKIRDAELMKIPYILVVGSKEAESDMVNVRERATDAQKSLSIEDFVALVRQQFP